MSDHAPPLNAAAARRAVRVPGQHKLTMPEPDRQSGGRRLTIATPAGGGEAA